MVAIFENSELYDKIFKGEEDPDQFVSRFPTWADLTNGFLDPSVKGIEYNQRKLNGDQTGDLRQASIRMLRNLSVDNNDSTMVNFPSMLLDGLFNVVKSSHVGDELSNNDVLNKVVSVPNYNTSGVGGIPGLVIGASLLTLSVTVPLLGIIASAIVGIGAGIAKAIKTSKEKKDVNETGVRAKLYKTFPPLQTGGSETDSGQVEAISTIFRTCDWTNLYAPRFKGEWRGIERVGGFAFAPGSVDTDASEFDADVNEKFIPTGGFGVIPGTNIVTSVIQVSLPNDPSDPFSGPFQNYITGKGPDPRTFPDAWSRVQDVGLYYPTTGQIGSTWWELALKEGNWYKFRIDTIRLHKEWKEYCDGGIKFIRNKCYKWTGLDINSDYEDYFGSGIFYGIGAWAGMTVPGGSSMYPNYQKFAQPVGYTRQELVTKDLYKKGTSSNAINSSKSGGFLPLTAITDQNGKFNHTWFCDPCLGTIYDRGFDIKSKLDDLKKRQEWDLYSSLASAYCSQFDAAFIADPKLKTLLFKRRKLLLTHPDRKFININDVWPEEPGLNKDNWRQELLDSGVPLKPKNPNMQGFGNKLSLGGDIPPGLKPPEQPGIDPGPMNPWDPKFTISKQGKSGKPNSNSLVLLGGLGIVALMMKGKFK